MNGEKLKVQLVDYTPNPEKLIAVAAKRCYSEKDFDTLWDSTKDVKDFIRNLKQQNHLTPFEMANFTFSIENISRVCLAQLTRHRLMSFNVMSQRYVKYDSDEGGLANIFVAPDAILKSSETLIQLYFDALEVTSYTYEEIVKELMKNGYNEKEAIENARYILPSAAKTSLILTANARELMHFFELRCCNRAQEEIRTLAWAMLDILQENFSVIFENCGPGCLTNGCKEGKMSCGKPYKRRI